MGEHAIEYVFLPQFILERIEKYVDYVPKRLYLLMKTVKKWYVQPLHEEIESESFVSEAGKKLGQRAECVSWDSFKF